MENANEPGPEESGYLHDQGGEVWPAAEAATGRGKSRRSQGGSGQNRWLWVWIGGALHLGALAILGLVLWHRYQPASEPDEKPVKSNIKVVKRGSRIDDGGSRLENRRSRIEDRGSKMEKNPSRSSTLEPPSSKRPAETQDIVGEIRSLTGHSDAVVSVAYFPDGHQALSGSYDGTLRIWDLETGQELRILGKVAGKILSVAISPDGRYALSGGEDRLVHLWDVENSQELFAFPGHLSYVTTVAFSPDGRYALSGGHDQALRLWDVEAQKAVPVVNRHAGLIRCVAFDPFATSSNGKEKELRALSCSSEDGTMRLWNVKKGRDPHRWKPPRAAVWSVAWGPAPSTLPPVANAGGPAHPGSPRGDGQKVRGSLALVGSSDGMVRLWDVESWRELRQFPGHKAAVTSVAISPDGRRALTGSEDFTIRLWDLESGEELRRFTRETIVATVAFSPDGRRALSGEFDRNLHLWGLPP
jgi:WD40 repeat protein